jgi:hypothetical protein
MKKVNNDCEVKENEFFNGFKRLVPIIINNNNDDEGNVKIEAKKNVEEKILKLLNKLDKYGQDEFQDNRLAESSQQKDDEEKKGEEKEKDNDNNNLDFRAMMNEIKHCHENQFACSWDSAIDQVFSRHFPPSSSDNNGDDNGDGNTGANRNDVPKYKFDEEEFSFFIQQLLDLSVSDTNNTNNTDSKASASNLYKWLKGVCIPLCMILAPNILGDLLMANKYNTKFINLMFDTTGSENLKDYFPRTSVEDIKLVYFSDYPSARLLQSIVNFLK